MATQPQNPEAGLRRHRLDFARELEFGVTGAAPDWLKYSTSFTNWTWSPDATIERIDSVGTPDPVDQEKGPEGHEMTVEYPLVKWFVTAGGDPLDAAYDGMFRTVDNLLPNSHTIVDREERELIRAEATINGATARPTRQFRVGKGGLIDSVDVSGDPGDSVVIGMELNYQFQKVRTYQVDQPTDAEGNTMLGVVSTNAGDTTQTVTIESEGATTSATYTLNGTTLVTDATTFGDIDAISLSDETAGDVYVFVNTGTDLAPTRGDDLAVIHGTGSYDGVEGDLGVPALGVGTREDPAALGGYEKFIGDTIRRGADPYPHELSSATLTVENNVDPQERSSGYGQALYPGNREITLDAEMFGEAMTYDMLEFHLMNNEEDHSWDMTGGTLVVEAAHLTEPGDVEATEGDAVLTQENTFRGGGLTLA